MNKQVNLDDVIDIMLEKLQSGGTVTFSPRGTSMMPMLRDGEDVVVLKKKDGKRRLHLFDLPLYRRADGTYVLHRVIDFDHDGSYVMRGDNQFVSEHGIKDDSIIAVVTAFYRKGKPYTMQSPSYRLYLDLWFYSYPFRYLYRAVKTRLFKALKVRKKGKKDEKKSDSD